MLESGKPSRPMAEYMGAEDRFRQIERKDPARCARLVEEAQRDAERRFAALTASKPRGP